MPEGTFLIGEPTWIATMLKKHTLFLWLKLVITIAALTYLFASEKLQLGQLAIRPGGWPWIAGAVGLVFGWIVLNLVRH